MQKLTDRRGRRYAPAPLDRFADQNVAYAAAILDEARERCIDVITDMPEDVMWKAPEGTEFTPGDLVLHMAWAEKIWLPRLGDSALSEESSQILERGRLEKIYDRNEGRLPVSRLVSLCREVRENVMLPCLSRIEDLDAPIPAPFEGGKGPATPRQVIMHVTWSWTYHTGQVGFICMMNGVDYQWAFA